MHRHYELITKVRRCCRQLKAGKPRGGVAVGGCAISVVLVLVAVVEVVVVSVATRKAAKMIHFNANLDSTSNTDCCRGREREG